MTEAMLKRILEEAQAKKGEGGEQELGEGRRLTVYASHAGVPLTVSKVVALKVLDGGTIQVRNDKGERTFLALEDCTEDVVVCCFLNPVLHADGVLVDVRVVNRRQKYASQIDGPTIVPTLRIVWKMSMRLLLPICCAKYTEIMSTSTSRI